VRGGGEKKRFGLAARVKKKKDGDITIEVYGCIFIYHYMTSFPKEIYRLERRINHLKQQRSNISIK